MWVYSETTDRECQKYFLIEIKQDSPVSCGRPIKRTRLTRETIKNAAL